MYLGSFKTELTPMGILIPPRECKLFRFPKKLKVRVCPNLDTCFSCFDASAYDSFVVKNTHSQLPIIMSEAVFNGEHIKFKKEDLEMIRLGQSKEREVLIIGQEKSFEVWSFQEWLKLIGMPSEESNI